MSVQKLVWTDPKKPGPGCSYDNMEAQTPFGKYLITWKSWKDRPSYAIEFQDGYVASENSLADARDAAQADYEKRIASSLGN